MDWTAQLKPNVDWTVQFLKQLWTGQPAKKKYGLSSPVSKQGPKQLWVDSPVYKKNMDCTVLFQVLNFDEIGEFMRLNLD